VKLYLDCLEKRETPNDLFGALAMGVATGGMTLLSGRLLTPPVAFLHGWEAGAPPRVAPEAGTVAVVTAAPERKDDTPERLAALLNTARLDHPEPSGSPPVQQVVRDVRPAGVVDEDWLSTVDRWLASRQPRAGYAEGSLGRHEPPSAGGSFNSPSPGGGSSSPTGSGGAGGRTSSSDLTELGQAMTSGNPVSPLPPAPPGGGGTPLTTGSPPSLGAGYGQMPIWFEPNVGQSASAVRYLAHGAGLGVYLTNNAVVFAVARPGAPGTRDAFQLSFAGANPAPTIVASDPQPGLSNYFQGSSVQQWHSGVARYGTLTVKSLYAGVDLVLHNSPQKQLEYDIVVAPGADPTQVRLNWQGLQSVQTDGQGNLMLGTAGGMASQQAPVFYQMVGGTRQTLTGSTVLDDASHVHFQPGTYDHTRPLVIDPVLGFSALLGGSGTDQANAVAVDSQGGIYLTGFTSSSDFPTTLGVIQSSSGGGKDVFVSRLDATGTQLLFSTYVGGSQDDVGNGIGVDAGGNIFVDGVTSSPDFPTFNTLRNAVSGTHAFVLKLNPTGTGLMFSTVLAGNGSEAAQALAVDPGGNAWVTGSTTSSNFPTTANARQTALAGVQNAFICQLNAVGSTFYSSYLGGSGSDEGRGIAVDGSGAVYVIGNTSSPNFPLSSHPLQSSLGGGANSGFVTKFTISTSATSVSYSTYLSASDLVDGNAIAADGSGNAYVTGYSHGSGFATVNQIPGIGTNGNNAFVSKINADGSALVYSDYLGGGGDHGYGIAVDSAGDAYVAGSTPSSAFPAVNPVQPAYGGGANDAFVTEFNAAGSSLIYSTWLGGSGDDGARGIVVDGLGNEFVAGYTGSSNFPVTNRFGPASGSTSAFVSALTVAPLPPIITAVNSGSPFDGGYITNQQKVILSGSAQANATVNLSRADLGVIGSTPVTGNLSWSYDYTGTTLAEGGYLFTATQTVNNVTSYPSRPFALTVDRTPPSVSLIAPANTASTAPVVQVNASDLNGLPDGTTVSLDLGSTQNYATGTLRDGFTTIVVPGLSPNTAYTLTARVTDLAGNQGSAAGSVTVGAATTTATVSGSQALSADPEQGMMQEQLGDVSVRQDLDLDQSPGTTQGGSSALVYHSSRVSVQPFVQVSIQTANATPLPSTISAQLTVTGTPANSPAYDTSSYSATGSLVTYGTSGFGPGDTLVASLQAPAALSTGRYDYSVQIHISGQADPAPVRGTFYVDAQDGSAFGAGWTFSGVDQLISFPSTASDQAGVLRRYGSGGWRFYASNGSGGYNSPAGDNGTLTLNGSTWTYRTPDGQTRTFSTAADGFQTQWTSPDGLTNLQYRYDGSNRLTGVTAIDGAPTALTYGPGVVTIQTSTQSSDVPPVLGSHTTSLSLTSNRLLGITNPDSGLHGFSYDSGGRVLTESLGVLQNGWAYYLAGPVKTAAWGGGTGSVSQISPAVLQGSGNLVRSPVAARVTDPDGHVTAYQLDGQGRPVVQTAADGGQTTTGYSNGFVTSVTDPLGRTTSYALDSKDYVTQTTWPDNSTRKFTYADDANGVHELVTLTNERTFQTTYAYDSQHHLTLTTDARGKTTKTFWDPNGLPTAVTDRNTNTTHAAYDTQRRVTKTTDGVMIDTLYSYDLNGNLTTVTSAEPNQTAVQYDVVTRTTFDLMNRLSVVQDALGNSTTMSYDPSGLETGLVNAELTTFSRSYDSRGLQVQEVNGVGLPPQDTLATRYDPAGLPVYQTDGNGAPTLTRYDPVGRPTRVTDPIGGVARMQYDLAGQQVASVDPLLRQTREAYNLRGWLSQQTDNLGHSRTTRYDPVGNVTTLTNALNETTVMGYDEVDRQTQVSDPAGQTTNTNYWPGGQVSQVTELIGTGPGQTLRTDYAYDGDNRLLETVEAANQPAAQQKVTVRSYDNAGNVTQLTDPMSQPYRQSFDKMHRATGTTDPNNNKTGAVFDVLGQLTQVIDGLNNVTATITYCPVCGCPVRWIILLLVPPSGPNPVVATTSVALNHAGETVREQDPLNAWTYTAYDALDRPVQTWDARGGITRTGYDADGEATSVTDAVGNTTWMIYDRAGRQTVRIDPLGARTTTGYDAGDRVTSVTDRDSRTQQFSYDLDDRVTQVVWQDSHGTTVNLLTYQYDHSGQLSQAADRNGTLTWTRDYDNRVSAATDVLGQTLNYQYNLDDRVTVRTDSQGGTLTNTYDPGQRLQSEQFSGTGATGTAVRVDFGYDARNLRTSQSYYGLSGSTWTLQGQSQYGYDAGTRTTSVTHSNGSGATLSQYTDTYDLASRLMAETRYSQPVGTLPTSYSYDSTNQLTSDGTATYSYDLAGNRTQVVTNLGMSNYQTGPGNRLTSDGTWTYTYDPEGNLVNKRNITTGELWTYTYDNLNHLTNASRTGGAGSFSVTYVYDVEGHRVEQIEQGTVTKFAYDGDNVWADLDGNNNILVRYLYGDGVDDILTRTVASGANAGVTVYLKDQLGSVRDLLAFSSQTIVDHRDYDGFGNIVQDTASTVGDRYGFTGREFDSVTGLQYNRERYYNPATGKWTSEDPLSFGAGDGNLYRYVGNNPTNATDPSGLVERPSGSIRSIEVEAEFFDRDPSRSPNKEYKFRGSTVMLLLGFHKYTGLFGSETWEYRTFAQGCMGLNKLRLNSDLGPFNVPGARVFATLDAALEAQKEMIRAYGKDTLIVITAYQDNYLNEQLTPFLLPGSKTEYDLGKITAIRGGVVRTGIKPRGSLSTFDFVTLHQNDDLSIRFYETMDFGARENPNLDVIHKCKLYSSTIAGTIYIVTPIKKHRRAPLAPSGSK
jgi:RHS repeat-associated protein